MTPRNVAERKSAKYKEWRAAVFARDGYTCVMCGKVGGRLNADHILPFAHYPELRLALDNGRTLCEPCHMATPTYLAKARWLVRSRDEAVEGVMREVRG